MEAHDTEVDQITPVCVQVLTLRASTAQNLRSQHAGEQHAAASANYTIDPVPPLHTHPPHQLTNCYNHPHFISLFIFSLSIFSLSNFKE